MTMPGTSWRTKTFLAACRALAEIMTTRGMSGNDHARQVERVSSSSLVFALWTIKHQEQWGILLVPHATILVADDVLLHVG